MRSPAGNIITYNAPGAGTGAYEGTSCPGCSVPLNLFGALAGYCIDQNFLLMDTCAVLGARSRRSGAVEPQIRDFNLASLFEELRVEFSPPAIKKGLRLEIAEVAAVAHSDPTLLGEILRSLMSNAIRYTPRGVVQVHCFREDADLMW